MSDLWKKVELEIARYFGTERTLLKGRYVEDFTTNLLVGEVKHRANLAKWIKRAWTDLIKYREKNYRPIAIICLHEYKQGYKDGDFWVITKASHFKALIDLVKSLKEKK